MKKANRKFVIGMGAAIGIVALAGLLAMNASAATINVPGDYTTIQDAIDNASDGDTIIVSGK